jgi:two-component system, sensor histidine kinase
VDAVRLVREVHPGLPAVIVSGDVAVEQLRAIEAAGLRLLHKPLTLEQLAAELRFQSGVMER